MCSAMVESKRRGLRNDSLDSWLPISQVGVRQELQDEAGAVMGMRVGERRRFAVPQELAFKRKAFGQPVPANQVCVWT